MVDLIDLDFKVKHLQTDAITRTLGRAPRLKVLAPFSPILIYPKFVRSKFLSVNVLESMFSPKMNTIPALSLHHSQPSFQTTNKDLKQKQFNIVPYCSPEVSPVKCWHLFITVCFWTLQPVFSLFYNLHLQSL